MYCAINGLIFEKNGKPYRGRLMMENNPNSIGEAWIENGILYGKYTVEHIDLDLAKKLIALRIEKSGDSTYPVFVDVTDVKTVSKEARETLATGDGIKNMSACALVVGSPVNRLLGNFFLSVSKPGVPTRLFTSKEDALVWLSTFKKEKVD